VNWIHHANRLIASFHLTSCTSIQRCCTLDLYKEKKSKSLQMLHSRNRHQQINKHTQYIYIYIHISYIYNHIYIFNLAVKSKKLIKVYLPLTLERGILEYMNIKLFYGISGSTTLGICELDCSMRTSKCCSPTRNWPLAIGHLVLLLLSPTPQVWTLQNYLVHKKTSSFRYHNYVYHNGPNIMDFIILAI
jgi:hypothetical protein